MKKRFCCEAVLSSGKVGNKNKHKTLKFLEVALIVFSGMQQAMEQKSSNVFPNKNRKKKQSTK